jgi:hypothetical protein
MGSRGLGGAKRPRAGGFVGGRREVMAGPGTFRRAVVYLFDRSPEILFFGGVGNGVITYFFYEFPSLRATFFFLLWAVLGGGYVFLMNFHWWDRREREPRPWRTLVTLELLYVAVAWAVLT